MKAAMLFMLQLLVRFLQMLLDVRSLESLGLMGS